MNPRRLFSRDLRTHYFGVQRDGNRSHTFVSLPIHSSSLSSEVSDWHRRQFLRKRPLPLQPTRSQSFRCQTITDSDSFQTYVDRHRSLRRGPSLGAGDKLVC